jgi:hypothetical protein
MTGVLFFCLVGYLFSVSFADYCGPWIPLDIHSLPLAKPDDQITLFYLIAPLMECDYGSDFSYLDAYHGGLGLVNVNSGFSITLNFDATPSFIQALIPNITDGELYWNNQGAVFIYSSINQTFWYSNREIVANLNGTTYNNLMKWIGSYNTTNPWYNIWTVLYNWPGKILFASEDCFSFVWNTFRYLEGLGVKIIPSKAKVSMLAFYSYNPPVQVDYTNPTIKKDIVKFYTSMVSKINSLGALGIIEVMLDLMLEENYYFHVGNSYYQVELAYPWVGTIYDYVPT